MKRILLLFSALMLSCIALWAHDVVIDGIYYDLDETKKTAGVTYRGGDYDDYDDEYSGSVTIPETITYNSEIYSVTYIDERAFYDCSRLTEVTIPNSVTYIGFFAFFGCSGLTKVNYLGTVDKWVDIDIYINSSFEDYSNPTYYAEDLYINNELLTDVKITTADAIKKDAFHNCQSIKSVEIGNSVTSIGENAFSGCSGLTSVTIPNSVTSIGWDAFEGCSGLTSVTIPNSVTSIGEDAFYSTGIYKNNSNWDNGVLYIDNCLIKAKSDVVKGSYTIKKGTRIIGSSAFEDCSGLTSVTIPNSVTSIGYKAFNSCSGLTSVTIGNSVTSFGWGAFNGCSGLTSVIWNAKNCEDFSSSTYSPFYDIRSSITSFTFGNEVEHIPAYLCYGMSKLTEITIPNSVTTIGSSAFSGCSGLTSVIWNAKNCEDFSSSTYSPFYDIRSSLTSFTFGNEVEHIPAYLCYYMNNLKEVTIGNSVTSIGQHAFFECSGLTKVNYLGTIDKWVDIDFEDYYSNPTYYTKDLYINNELLTDVKITSTDSIKGCAFINCQSIKSVEIGNSVTSIGRWAFYDCSGLTKVNYLGTVDKWVEIDFDDDNLSPTYYAKDLYINNELLTDVKITTADSIKNYVFYNCQSIKSVEIGESVTSIGKYAFSGCDKLRKVTAYPTTVPNAYESSFAHYNAYLYVPCDVYEDYDLDDVFGSFKYIKCIAAEEVDAPNKVEIEVDEDNNAIVIWPSTDGAKKYELEISKDGEVFCTLLFNENGQLTSIDFGNRSASVGFQFTVTGLDSASKYAYSMVAMDKKGNELQSYKGTFTTNGYVPGPGEEDEPTSITETLADANITVSGGTISADADFSIYNTIGQDVTAFNGSLQPGVYLVSIENNIVKVMVH